MGVVVGDLLQGYRRPVPDPACHCCLAIPAEDGLLALSGCRVTAGLSGATMTLTSVTAGHGCAAPLVGTAPVAAAWLCAHFLMRMGDGCGPSLSGGRPRWCGLRPGRCPRTSLRAHVRYAREEVLLLNLFGSPPGAARPPGRFRVDLWPTSLPFYHKFRAMSAVSRAGITRMSISPTGWQSRKKSCHPS